MASWDCSTAPTESEGGSTIARTFEWSYDRSTFTWETEFSEQLYEIQRRRHRIYDYGAYVADTFTQEFFSNLANRIQSLASENRWGRSEVVEFATRFVQSLPYTVDSASTGYDNYPRYPIETLVDETGDCEDTSLLLAAILHGLGYHVVLLEFDSHLGVGVSLDDTPENITFDGTGYSYIEPTDTGWDVGELSPHLAGESVERHCIDNSPALYANWKGTTQGQRFHCGGAIFNAGEGPARDVTFQVFLNDRDGDRVTAIEQRWERIQSGRQVEWTDQAPVESGRYVTPEWVLGVEGIVHDEGEQDRQRI